MVKTNEEVKLAEPGTIMARFQKERTDAISEMFDNPYIFDKAQNEIYPTSKFFVRLDKALQKALSEQKKEIINKIEQMPDSFPERESDEFDKGYCLAQSDIKYDIEEL